MINNRRVVGIIQARMTSTRLPGKTMLPLAGKPVLQHIIERLRLSEYIDEVVVACTTNHTDDILVELCDRLDCKYYRGSEDDVMQRVVEACEKYEADIIVDVTSDCPCVCGGMADQFIVELIQHDADYASNVINRTYPRGLDLQVFTYKALEQANREVDNDVDRSHVSSWIYKNPKTHDHYKLSSITADGFNYSDIRLTLDTEEDYQLLRLVFESFIDNAFTSRDIERLIKWRSELFEINKHVPQKSYYKELVEAYKI